MGHYERYVHGDGRTDSRYTVYRLLLFSALSEFTYKIQVAWENDKEHNGDHRAVHQCGALLNAGPYETHVCEAGAAWIPYLLLKLMPYIKKLYQFIWWEMSFSRTEKNRILDHSSCFLSPVLFPLSFYTLHMRSFFRANFPLNSKSLSSMDLKNEHFGNVHCGLETNIFHKFLHLTQTPSSQFSQEHPYSSPVLLWVWRFSETLMDNTAHLSLKRMTDTPVRKEECGS